MFVLKSVLISLVLTTVLICINAAVLEGGRAEKFVEVQSLVYDAQMGNSGKSLEALQQIVYKAIDPTYQGLVVKAGALPFLLRQLQVGSDEAKLAACTALGALTADDEDRLRIGETNAVNSMLGLLSEINVEIKLVSLQTLGNLMQDHINQQQLIANEGADQLVSLLSDSDEQIRRVAAGTIGNIAIHSEYIPALVTAGCVAGLVDLLREESIVNTDPQTIEVTAGALRNLVQLDETLDAMLEVGSFEVLERLLEDGSNTDDTKILANELLDFLTQYEKPFDDTLHQQDEL